MVSRRLAKTITWRFIASGTTFAVSWIITGKIASSLGITLVNFFVKPVFYYLHEWAWDQKKEDVKVDEIVAECRMVPVLHVFVRGRLVKEIIGGDLNELNRVLQEQILETLHN